MGEQQHIDLENTPGHDKLEEQERVEILEEIDKVVDTNRLPISDDMEKLKPTRKGLAFPLLINIFAIAAVLTTIYFSNRMFQQKQENLSLENASYQSAEGKLLEELKRESEEKLNQKDEEIGAIQDELAELDRQSRELAETMDQQIADRETELRLALEEELERERRNLQSQGKTEADIEEELQRIEQERTTEYEAELTAFKNETEQAIAEKEEELTRAKQLNEELLAEVNSEKDRIANETRARESELTAQFEEEKAALAEEAATAAEQLEQLTKKQAQESLMIDQINGSYDNIFSLINNGNYEEALTAISALKQLIENPDVVTLPAVKDRNETDNNMLEMLREKIEEQTYKESADSRSLAAAADLLLSAQEIAQRGATSYAAGNNAEAQDYYTRSLQKIPALRGAWEDLKTISAESEKTRLTELISRGNSLREEGDLEGASEQFAAAASSADAKNPELLKAAVAGLTETAQQLRTGETSERDSAYRRLEDDSRTEIDRLSSSLAQAEKEYQQKLSSTETGYETRLAEASNEYSDLEASKNEEIDRLSRMIGERDQENLRINTESEDKSTELADAKSRIAELETALTDSENRAEEINDSLTEAGNTLASKTAEAAAAGYSSGYAKGRYAAFEDVLYFTSYISGSSTSQTAEKRITDLAEAESIYAQTVQEITSIAAAGGEDSETDAIRIKQNILIGSISYASGNTIIIEPLTDLVIDDGTEIIIKRKERGRPERYISTGTITSASADRIEADIIPEASGKSVRSLDLVYIIINQ